MKEFTIVERKRDFKTDAPIKRRSADTGSDKGKYLGLSGKLKLASHRVRAARRSSSL